MMTDHRTMAELLRAPTEGYAEAIVVPLILAEQFELKHSLITMMTSDQFFELEKDNPHDHIRWFNKITSTIKYKDVPNSAIKLMLFPFSLAGAACRWLEKEPSHSIHTWEDLVSKFINEFFPPSRTINLRNEISNFQQRFNESFHEAWDRCKDLLYACPHHGFTKLHQLDTFYNALNPVDKDSLNAAAGGNLLERRTQDVLTIIENKSKQTSVMTIAMMAMLKQFQATPPPASVRDVKKPCVTCGGAHPYYHCLAVDGNTFSKLRDNIQGYISAVVVNYNQGNPGYHPPAPTQQNQNVHLNELEKVRRMNKANMKAMQTQFDMVKNELRNEMKNLIQASLSNQTNEIKNIMAGLFQKKSASTSGSGSLSSNTVANSKGELKPITTRSGSVLDGPTVPTPTPFINPKEDERVEETLTDPNLVEYTSKVPPPPLHINITLVDALILMPKYQKMLKALLSNKEKLQELANIPLNENCSAVILKKLPEKLRDPGKFLSLYGFSELKCKALANLGVSINLMPLFVWKKLERINLINVFNNSSDDFLEDLFSNQPSGNPTFSSHPELTSLEVNDDIFDSEGGNVLSEKLLDLDSTKDLHPLPLHVNSLIGSTTYSSNPLLEEFTDELALITFPLKCDNDLQFDIESDLKEIEFLLYQDIDSSLKDSIDQLIPLAILLILCPRFEFDAENVYDDPFDFKGEKINDSKLLIDELDLPCDFLPFKYDSFISQDFSRVDALPLTNNEDKIFNL
nr:reverse transcriptase domain-containing protein [Tanacetum cinerariifolium]